MSLYTALTETLSYVASKLNGIKTGFDGTTYDSPGEAVREQINDLHVLIGHVPGQAIDASAVAYNDSNVAAELTNVNGRLGELKNANSALTELVNENILLRWEQGTLNSSNGEELSSAKKIRTQTIDISKYTSVTFNNTSGYKFRTVWLDADGAVVKEALYLADRTVTSISYGFMSRYNIAAVRVVLGKTSDDDIVPSEGGVLTITGVMEIETKVNKINTTLSNDYKYADTDYKQVPLTDVVFSVGNINETGAETSGYRPYTSFINLDNDMHVKCDAYINVFVYKSDGTFVNKTGWVNGRVSIPFAEDRKVRILFDKSSTQNNSTSPQIDQIINSGLYIGVKRKEADDLKGKAQIYIIRPNRAYIEQTYTDGGSVYFHFDGNIAVRVITDVTKSISALATEIGTTLVTSPNGVQNCIEIADTMCLVFNISTHAFKMVARTSISNEMIVVINCAGGKVINSLDSFTFDGIYNLSSEINDLSAELGNSYITDSVDSVVNNMANQNGNCLNLAFITDLHVTAFEDLPLKQIEVWKRNTNGLACVDESRNIDFVVLGGDYLWNNTSTTLARAERAYKLLQECFYQFKDKQFALKGNHDDNSIAKNADYIIGDSMRYGYLGQQYTNAVNIKYGNAEKSYGYIDFKRQKVRAIFINTVDIPTSYGGQHITGVGNDQLNFIADTLKFTEDGWAVIFFSHHVIVNNVTMAIDGEAYLTPTHGGDALWGMIQAYKNKTAYSKVSTLTDYEYSVNVDYRNNGSSEVIACINGHTHKDLSATQDGVLLLSTTASGFGQSAYDSDGNKITRTINTVSETSYDIYSVDRINRAIKASRYGAGQNRIWIY